MKFFPRTGTKYPACYGNPQDFLDALAAAMDFQDTQTIPLFYNGHLNQNTNGFGPPKYTDTTGTYFYGDAVWWDPRKGGSLLLDGNLTTSVREQLPSTRGYLKYHGRSFGDIVPFIWQTNSASSYMPLNNGGYYWPDDVACVYNNWSRKVAVTTNTDPPVTYNITQRPWVFCDGYNYGQHPIAVQQSPLIGIVPNLISRMIVGNGFTSPAGGLEADERMPATLKGGLKAIGGSMSSKIDQTGMLPNHRHTFIDKQGYQDVNTSSASTGASYTSSDPIANASSYATNTTGARSGTGNDQAWPFVTDVKPHQNMPPYYVVGFKMYVGYEN